MRTKQRGIAGIIGVSAIIAVMVTIFGLLTTWMTEKHVHGFKNKQDAALKLAYSYASSWYEKNASWVDGDPADTRCAYPDEPENRGVCADQDRSIGAKVRWLDANRLHDDFWVNELSMTSTNSEFIHIKLGPSVNESRKFYIWYAKSRGAADTTSFDARGSIIPMQFSDGTVAIELVTLNGAEIQQSRIAQNEKILSDLASKFEAFYKAKLESDPFHNVGQNYFVNVKSNQVYDDVKFCNPDGYEKKQEFGCSSDYWFNPTNVGDGLVSSTSINANSELFTALGDFQNIRDAWGRSIYVNNYYKKENAPTGVGRSDPMLVSSVVPFSMVLASIPPFRSPMTKVIYKKAIEPIN